MSSVAAPCALRVVEGDDVEIGRVCEMCVDVALEVAECFEDDTGDIADFAWDFDVVVGSAC